MKSLENVTKGTEIARQVELADSFFRRLRGLLGRTRLEPGHALIIDETNSIHMFFMLFSIDVIFTDENGVVLAVFPRRRPFSLPVMSWKAFYAIELEVGVIEASRTDVGDRLEW